MKSILIWIVDSILIEKTLSAEELNLLSEKSERFAALISKLEPSEISKTVVSSYEDGALD